jgi:hypothetical protein
MGVLPVDYLRPDVAHAVPELAAPGGWRRRTQHRRRWPVPVPWAAGYRRSLSFACAPRGSDGEVMPWHFLGIPLGSARA